jgi:hypothetical protein
MVFSSPQISNHALIATLPTPLWVTKDSALQRMSGVTSLAALSWACGIRALSQSRGTQRGQLREKNGRKEI